MKDGIPDKAYTALSGDDKTTCTALKRSNRSQAGGRQAELFKTEVAQQLASTLAALDSMPEDTVDAIAAKRAAFAQAEGDQQLANERLRCDLFCVAFFAPKSADNAAKVPLSGDLVRASEGQPMRPGVSELARELADEYRFFHWRLAFPEVFARGGFDVVLANPPWERIKLQEQEFFGPRSPEIANAVNAAARTRLIAALNRNDASPGERRLYRDFIMAKRGAEGASLFAHESQRFRLTGIGDVNLYALFSESAFQLIGEHGTAGVITPTGIATDDSTKAFFEFIATSGRLRSLIGFENEEFIFPAVHHSFRFCLLLLQARQTVDIPAKLVFFLRKVQQINDTRRYFSLSAEEFALLNPNTLTCPIFRSENDANLNKKIYRRIPILIDESKGAAGNPWGISFTTMFHMANDSGLFKTKIELIAAGAIQSNQTWQDPDGASWVPLYEAKMIHQFDHRWAEYEDNGSNSVDITDDEKKDFNRFSQPRYWIKDSEKEAVLEQRHPRNWLVGWRDITSAHVLRTVIATVIPRVAAGNTLPLMFVSYPDIKGVVALIVAPAKFISSQHPALI